MPENDNDKVEKLPCGSLIQHGKSNDRIYLMKVAPGVTRELPELLISMAEIHGYSKIFAKVSEEQADIFYDAGFVKEASVPNFYGSESEGIFFAFYLHSERAHEHQADVYDENIKLALKKQRKQEAFTLDGTAFSIRKCDESDAADMAQIYKKVFASYPFPIDNPEYIIETMRDNVDYFCVEKDDIIIALASSEKDIEASNVEMTDFATLPEWRGNGLAVHLLKNMEKEMKKQGIKTAYTIARAASPGMNITFSKLGYSFGGRLKNNTDISGTIESMNVWYKRLQVCC